MDLKIKAIVRVDSACSLRQLLLLWFKLLLEGIVAGLGAVIAGSWMGGMAGWKGSGVGLCLAGVLAQNVDSWHGKGRKIQYFGKGCCAGERNGVGLVERMIFLLAGALMARQLAGD